MTAFTVPEVHSATGIAIPAIIYGTAWKQDRTAMLVEQAVDAGFRGIDTACQPKHYHEAGVGEALKSLYRRGMRREQFYLQSKFTPIDGQDPARTPYDPLLPIVDQVSQSFAVSQYNLDSDYLDTLILHSPIYPFSLTMEAWHGMETIAVRGGAKQLGISNCYDLAFLKALYEAAEVKPAVVQNRFYHQTGYDRALRQWCVEQGIIYQSFWTLTANTHILNATPVIRLARQYHCEPAQIFLRYVSQRGVVPLTGTTSAEHMRQDLQLFAFQLDADALSSIDTLLD